MQLQSGLKTGLMLYRSLLGAYQLTQATLLNKAAEIHTIALPLVVDDFIPAQ